MDTHVLPPEEHVSKGGPSLPEGALALRASVRGRRILEVSPELARMLGDLPDAIVGRPLGSLWPPEEREAIQARFDGVVLLGRDSFGAVALESAGPGATLVEVDARYSRDGGEYIEAILWPVRRTSDSPDGSEGPGQWPGAVEVAVAAGAGTARVGPPSTDEAGASAVGQEGDSDLEVDSVVRGHAPGVSPEVMLTVLEAAGCAALLVDAEGTVIGATPDVGEIFSVTAAALEGQPLEEVFEFPGPAGEALAAARSARERQTVRAEPQGGNRQLLLEWVPMEDQGAGAALLTLTADQDESGETERLRFQAQLVSHVAHDLRDASASVFCGIRTLVDELDDETELHETAEAALVESQRVNRIIDEVLAVSRPGRLRRVDIDLNHVLHETLSRYQARATEVGVELEERLGPAAIVSADRSSLERGFGNLIENAIQEMSDGGRLIVATELEERVGHGVLATVADTGGGIDPEMEASVFDPFVTGKEGGSGLGLAITRRVVLDHGGQIDFETTVGEGTTFRVWLPCIE
jgi:signal transduction histidine kinase